MQDQSCPQGWLFLLTLLTRKAAWIGCETIQRHFSALWGLLPLWSIKYAFSSLLFFCCYQLSVVCLLQMSYRQLIAKWQCSEAEPQRWLGHSERQEFPLRARRVLSAQPWTLSLFLLALLFHNAAAKPRVVNQMWPLILASQAPDLGSE